jgi:rhodanese-related sulfurtransferase
MAVAPLAARPADAETADMPTITSESKATAVPAASAADAHEHFAARLAVETDCADVAVDLAAGTLPYTVLDVRGPHSYAAGRVPGALNVPSSSIDAGVAAGLPDGLLVVYCWGPGCNGAHKAAAALSAHGRQVKEMIGGFEYWVREGQPVEGEQADHLATLATPDLVG